MLKPWQRVIVAITVIAIAQVACSLQYKRVRQVGDSMKPNITDGDVLNVKEVPLSDLKRGDILLFEDEGRMLIKRLIGLPGETVAIQDGIVFINGSPLDEPYEPVPAVYSIEEVHLDDSSYFVLGDNRPDSLDSRQLGPIKGEAIKGKVITD